MKRRPSGLLILVAVMVGAALILTACPSPATPTPTPTAPTPAVRTPTPALGVTPAPGPTPAAVAKPTGELRVALSSFVIDVLNPIIATLPDTNLLSVMYDHLLGANPDGTIAPGLAERWEMAANSLSWTFYLRKGLKFHNGEALTAEDVKFSLLAFTNRLPGAPRAISSYAVPLAKTIKDLELLDDYTIRVHTTDPDVHFPYKVAPLQATEGIVMPKDYIERVGWEEFRQKPVGSGPWKLVEHLPGSYVRYEAVEGHWRQTPAFQRLIFLLVPEESTRIALLRTGQADIIEIQAESKKAVERAGFWVSPISTTGQTGVRIHATYYPEVADKPIANLKARQALSMVINREEIIKFVLEGEGSPTYPWQVFPFSPDVDLAALPRPEYDPERAKKLLVEAGYPQGFAVDMYSFPAPGAPYLPRMAEAVAGYWEKIGVKTNILPIDFGSMITMHRKHPVVPALLGRTSIFTSPAKWVVPPGLRVFFHSQDIVRLLNMPEFDQAVDAAAMEVNPPKRKELTMKAASLAHNQYAVLAIAYSNSVYGMSNKIKSWRPIAGWSYIGLVLETVEKRG